MILLTTHFIYILLGLFSILIITILFERLVFLFHLKALSAHAIKQTIQQLHRNRQHYDSHKKEQLIIVTIADITHQARKGIGLLKLAASLSPLLGILGTIIGIIGAFQTIAEYDGPISPSLIASNLSVALVTTGLGLVVAIFAILIASLIDISTRNFATKLHLKLTKTALTIS